MLVEVNGQDTSGTTMFVYYDNGDGTYTLLGSASNTPAAVDAKDGQPLACSHTPRWFSCRMATSSPILSSSIRRGRFKLLVQHK
jgi:hypothetical protein